VPRNQLNFRLSEGLEKLIDKKRIELSKQLGGIPSRSEIIRLALAAYFGVKLSDIEVDGRKARHQDK
jgi:hypothetical protein